MIEQRWRKLRPDEKDATAVFIGDKPVVLQHRQTIPTQPHQTLFSSQGHMPFWSEWVDVPAATNDEE